MSKMKGKLSSVNSEKYSEDGTNLKKYPVSTFKSEAENKKRTQRLK